MTRDQLLHLCIRVDRLELEARDVVAFADTLAIPDECLEAFLEATAELANLADRLAEAPEPGEWLRVARAAAGLVNAPLHGDGPRGPRGPRWSRRRLGTR